MRPMRLIISIPAFAIVMALALQSHATEHAATGQPARPAEAAARGDAFDPKQIIALMRRVADWGLANNNTYKLNMNRDADWSTGTFRAGVMAVYRTTRDERYLKNTLAWGEANNWKLRGNGGGDDSCAGQTYCEMYLLAPKPENAVRYAHTKQCFDRMLFDKNFNGFRLWSWQDALFMGTPDVAMLGKITGDKKYYDRLVTGWNDAARQLYDRDRHMYHFRESADFKTTRKGHPKFWGPGNAWVLAGATRCLMYMPKDYERRGEFFAYYKDMCAAIAAKQQPDGFWRTSLFEPTEFPDPESSCTAFFVFSMGRGILEGWLDKETYLPVVCKGWSAVVTAVDDKGKLGRCQPWSNQPGVAPRTHNMPEGSGAFLLAGEVVHQLAEKGFFKQ